ncbi:hypothetical protein CYMTET_5117 [Cymbomonas tetramitiformis]|uniref:BACK domain-containing protein n=1 Tax=Cymbomonas tetramitiformis TaxID=36881 RepID=A0AAE0H025_9CHLO|nr:hypothetical protein CYMTET_5117 [Cymbomonas tetramitiformis]
MGAAFSAVLDFMYLGVCELVDDSLLVPVLEAASLLQIQSLIDLCANAIAERISLHSCVGAWALAERHELPSLAVAAQAQTRACFGDLPLKALVVIEHHMLCALLADDQLVVQSEELLFEAVERWYAAQSPPPTADATAELVERIRFPLMGQTFVNDKVLAAPMMQTLPASKALAKVLLANMLTPAKYRIGMNIKLRVPHCVACRPCRARARKPESGSGYLRRRPRRVYTAPQVSSHS